MLKITILTVGKLKERYWAEAEAEYIKRLSSDIQLEFKELKEEAFDKKSNVEIIKEKEAEKIKKVLEKKEGYIVALNGTGKQFSSTNFAKHLVNLTNNQISHIIFVIGGPLGLDKSIVKLADLQLSLSNLTFPHQMVRTILLEQIYRAFTIIKGKQYHY